MTASACCFCCLFVALCSLSLSLSLYLILQSCKIQSIGSSFGGLRETPVGQSKMMADGMRLEQAAALKRTGDLAAAPG